MPKLPCLTGDEKEMAISLPLRCPTRSELQQPHSGSSWTALPTGLSLSMLEASHLTCLLGANSCCWLLVSSKIRQAWQVEEFRELQPLHGRSCSYNLRAACSCIGVCACNAGHGIPQTTGVLQVMHGKRQRMPLQCWFAA